MMQKGEGRRAFALSILFHFPILENSWLVSSGALTVVEKIPTSLLHGTFSCLVVYFGLSAGTILYLGSPSSFFDHCLDDAHLLGAGLGFFHFKYIMHTPLADRRMMILSSNKLGDIDQLSIMQDGAALRL